MISGWTVPRNLPIPLIRSTDFFPFCCPVFHPLPQPWLPSTVISSIYSPPITNPSSPPGLRKIVPVSTMAASSSESRPARPSYWVKARYIDLRAATFMSIVLTYQDLGHSGRRTFFQRGIFPIRLLVRQPPPP